MSVTPFPLNIPQATLDDLRARLARTRWPDEVDGAGWDYGSNLAYMKGLVEYWQYRFDWRAQEQAINRFAHFRAEVDGLGLHFIHERGKGPRPAPLLLLHGWPATFLQMLKIIPLLTDPASHGGDPADAFDVVVPDLPGYGFSDRPRQKGMTVARIGDLVARLMVDELGYRRFAIRGSDLGAGVGRSLAFSRPDAVTGLHVSGSNPYVGGDLPTDLTAAEQKFMSDAQRFMMEEGAYGMLQRTKPQTLAYGLNDSPAGLAAWIVEKYRTWSDCGGDVERRFTKDELLTTLTVYWATATIGSSVRLYYETGHGAWPGRGQRVEVPVGMAMFPKDLVVGPREWEERFSNVQHWTDMPRGGHFGEMEEPELIAEDIRAFFRPLR